MNININIERIVLDGVDSQFGSPQFEHALRMELCKSLAVSSGSSGKSESRELGTIAGGQTQLSDHQQVAQHVARQIAKGIQP